MLSQAVLRWTVAAEFLYILRMQKRELFSVRTVHHFLQSLMRGMCNGHSDVPQHVASHTHALVEFDSMVSCNAV